MSGRETIEFPPPVGRVEALYTLHSEVAMFPRSFPGLREASFKVAFEPDFTDKVVFLVELGFASREKVGGCSPREMLLTLAAGQSTVRRRGEMVVLPHPEWKVAAGALDTGVPLSIAGQLLASGAIDRPGVLCPEIAVPPELFFDMLERRHMRVHWS